MVVSFWQQEPGCDSDNEILNLITDDLEYAKEIIQNLADYDQLSYFVEVHQWQLIPC